jgi:hypothetical protein
MKSALAAMETTAIGRQLGSPRTARAIDTGASSPGRNDQQNAIACTQPCQVAGLPPVSIGTSTRKRGQDQRHPQQG